MKQEVVRFLSLKEVQRLTGNLSLKFCSIIPPSLW